MDLRISSNALLAAILSMGLFVLAAAAEAKKCDPTQAIADDAKSSGFGLAMARILSLPLVEMKCGSILRVWKLSRARRTAGSELMDASALDIQKAEEQIRQARSNPAIAAELDQAQSEPDPFARAMIEAAIFHENGSAYYAARDLRLSEAKKIAGEK